MKNLKNKIKNMKGITLISLVVTIIILIIISSVSIGIILGNNGLIDRTKTAKEEYQNSVDDENKKLEEIYSKLLLADSSGTTLENVDMKTLEKLILDKTYPIGSIFITIDETNPSTTLGGEWESYGEGRTLIGAGTGTDSNNESKSFTANSTGGEYNHTLTIAEMPSHSHAVALNYANYNHSSGATMLKDWGWGNSFGDADESLVRPKGGSQSHNNIQPYIVTYMWKRIK